MCAYLRQKPIVRGDQYLRLAQALFKVSRYMNDVC